METMDASQAEYAEVIRIREVILKAIMENFPPQPTGSPVSMDPIIRGRSSLISTALIFLAGDLVSGIKDVSLRAMVVERYQKQLAEIAFYDPDTATDARN